MFGIASLEPATDGQLLPGSHSRASFSFDRPGMALDQGSDSSRFFSCLPVIGVSA